jgi:hypothetical protein
MAEQRDVEDKILSSLVALKLATFLDTRDREFEQAGNSVTYLADADVFGLAIETPSEKISQGQLDGGREGAGLNLFEGPNGKNFHVPAEYETADYLFSGSLPAQQGKPIYFSDMHLREVERMRQAISARPPAPPPIASGSADELLKAELEAFSKDIVSATRGGIDVSQILSLCERAAELTTRLFEPPHETRAPRTFRSTETILAMSRIAEHWRPARQLEEYQQIADKRQPSEVTEWCARIATERRGERFISLKAGLSIYRQMSDRLRERILYDACTLVDVIEWNRRLPATAKVVLITGTTSLHRAYAEWYVGRRDRNTKEEYLLRSSIQYLPLLNLVGYGRVYDLPIDFERSARTFREIVSSLDAFLDPLRPAPAFTRVLELMIAMGRHQRRAPGGVFTLIDLQFELWSDRAALYDIAHKWQLAYCNAILITVPVLGSRRAAHDFILRAALQQAGGDLLSAQNNIVTNLEIAHLASSLIILGGEVYSELEQISFGAREQTVFPAAALTSRRPVLLILIDLPFKTKERLGRVLEGPVEAAIDEIRSMSHEQVSSKPEPADIIMSIIASMSLGSWIQAKRLAEHGAQATANQVKGKFESPEANDGPLLREFRYLYSLAVRFNCRSSGEYDRAFRFLSFRRDGGERDIVLWNARSCAERGTLQLAAALRIMAKDRLGRAETWPEFEGEHLLRRSAELIGMSLMDLRHGFYDVRDIHFADDPAAQIICDRLKLQTAANALCAIVMGHLADSSEMFVDGQFAHDAEESVAPYYSAGEQLRPISLLNFEAYKKVMDSRTIFPGPKGAAVMRQFVDSRLFEDYPLYRRFVADSDLDLSKLYQATFVHSQSA